MNNVLHHEKTHDFVHFSFASIDIHHKKEYNIILEV